MDLRRCAVWLLLPAAACAAPGDRAVEAEAPAAADFLATIPATLAAKGPLGWLDVACADDFAMASDGALKFASFAALRDAMTQFAPTVAGMHLAFRDLAVTPLAPGLASFGAGYEEEIAATDGTRQEYRGYVSGVVRRTAAGWRVTRLHWSSPPPPPPTPTAAEPAAEPPAAAPHPTQARLLYELPIDAMQRAAGPGAGDGLEGAIVDAIAKLRARLAELGKVERSGTTGFTVLVPKDRVGLARRRVESSGRLEVRLLADEGYRSGDVRFDLPAERRRLRAWLDAGGRERLLADPDALAAFHRDRRAGPLAGASLRWFVRRVEEDPDRPGRWQSVLVDTRTNCDAFLPLYGEADWNEGVIPPHRRRGPGPPALLELVAVNMHAGGFVDADFGTGWHEVSAPRRPQLVVPAAPERRHEFAEWTGLYKNREAAVLAGGELVGTWRLAAGVAAAKVTGDCTRRRLEEVELLRRHALAGRPRLVRIE